MQKKLLSVFLVFCLTLLLIPTALAAPSAQAEIQVGTATAKSGEMVEIPVTITTNPGIAAATFDVSYDGTALTLQSIVRGTVFSSGEFNTNGNRIIWYNSSSNVTENGVLFTLEFEVNSGSGGVYDVDVGLAGGLAANLTDYDFNPVTPRFTKGSVNVALDNFVITFDANGGTVTPTSASTGVDGKLSDLPTPAYTGYTFDGWYTAATGGVPVTVDTVYAANTTIYAHWTQTPVTPVTYTITFDANGGTVTPTTATTGADGKLSTLPTPARTGYTFDGWFTTPNGGTPVTADTVHTENATIYAHWTQIPVTPVTYTITFNANDGTVSPATAETNTDGKLSSLPTPIRTGYTFDGWFSAVTGGTQVTVDTRHTANTTIYAHWTRIPASYSITFDPNGGAVTPTTSDTGMDGKLPSLPTPTRTGYTFAGWYTSPTGGSRITLDAVFDAATTLYAHWVDDAEDETYISIPSVTGGEVIPSTRYAASGDRVTLTAHPASGYELDSLTVTDSRGRDVTLRSLGDGRYSFTMPTTRVTVDAVFRTVNTPSVVPSDEEGFTGLGTPGISGIVLNPAAMPFTDVHSSDWFFNSVEYMWKHYLMSGVSDTQFAPSTTTSRAMIWTVLARMNNVRTDINPGSTWYEKGMLWAKEQGVTDGSNPMNDITREQLATMLWRNAGSPGGTADLNQFSDSGSVSDYAASAIRWAVANGILQGSDGKLNPKGTATRAQVAAMVQRYGERIGA